MDTSTATASFMWLSVTSCAFHALLLGVNKSHITLKGRKLLTALMQRFLADDHNDAGHVRGTARFNLGLVRLAQPG